VKKIIYMSIMSILLFTGCATNTGPTYDANSYNRIKKVETGVVLESKLVTIRDDGAGKFLGAIVGAVLGSTIGSGSGKTLAVLGGGLVGGYAGNEIGKANAQELTVELDNSEVIVVVAKVKGIFKGDKVRIVKDGNRVASVNRVN